MNSIVSLVMSDPCSMQSMPASTPARIPLIAMGVRGDLYPAPVRLVDDRPQLLVGEVLGSGRPGERHHAPGCADLDDLGAVLDSGNGPRGEPVRRRRRLPSSTLNGMIAGARP